MKPTEYSFDKSPGADWQILGQLELPVTSNADNSIRIWLTEILGPLELPADLMSKILKSAQDSASRAMQVEVAQKSKHLHLLILVNPERVTKGGTWGFFRIEKIGNTKANESPPDYATEFYLYLEG